MEQRKMEILTAYVKCGIVTRLKMRLGKTLFIFLFRNALEHELHIHFFKF